MAPDIDVLRREWLDGLRSSRTRQAYDRDLETFTRWSHGRGRSVLDADEAEVAAFGRYLERAGSSAATTSRRLSGLSSFFAHAVSSGVIASNPAAGSHRSKLSEPTSTGVLGPEETERLRRSAAGVGDRALVVVSLLLDGLRLGEVLDLDAEHIDRRTSGTEVRVTRRGVHASVPVSDASAEAIETCLGRRRTGPLLVGESPSRHPGQRLTRFGADYLIKQSAARAGFTGSVTASMLRRTFMVLAHRAGSAVEDIQRAAGHGSRRETERFLAGRGPGDHPIGRAPNSMVTERSDLESTTVSTAWSPGS